MLPENAAVNVEIKLLFRRVFKALTDQKGWGFSGYCHDREIFTGSPKTVIFERINTLEI